MKAYHTTPDGQAILRDGFSDGIGHYGMTREWRGVWLADQPLGVNEGASGEDVLVVMVPDEVFVDHEWVQEPSFGYREALVPAVLVNQFPRQLLADEDDEL